MLLNCHTYYSLRYGTYATEELLEALTENGHADFALTDINNTSAVLDTIRLAKEYCEKGKPLRPVIGIDFRNGVHPCYVGLAKNNAGYRELNEHLSAHLHGEKEFDAIAPEFENAYVIYPFSVYKGWKLRPYEYIGVSTKDLSRLPFSPHARRGEKFVVLQPVTFAGKRQFNAHRLLRSIALNTLLSKLPATEQASPEDVMISRTALEQAFREYPLTIQNTKKILHDCHVDFEYGKFANKNLHHYTGSSAGDLALLRAECEKGLRYRFGDHPSQEVLDRVEKELSVITAMKFASYFLINWDIVTYAQSKKYYYVGRGSGANSMVAYLLRITDVDPIELDLYFERFINIHRSNPPDFDIDFSWTDRDDITRYIFERFGKGGRVALLGAYNTFQSNAVTRELGKVFGLPAGEIDRLQDEERLHGIDELGLLVLKYSKLIGGFPSHLSIHSSGILISEEPLTAYSATFMPPKGYPTTQFSMIEAEDIGLYKFDILSQRGLGKIKDALSIVKANKGVEIDIHDLQRFKKDEHVKDLLRVGNTIGCFYVESPAMRMLLAKLRADDYLRLVAASSIIRPGVAKSGMMRAYIVRYRDENERKKARDKVPVLYDLLGETYGVMVYQEDVIRVAHAFAGLSLAEADYLRRGMSWKFKQRNEFWRVKEKFFSNCLEKGYSDETIGEIWMQIESFANYAFSKGHSASYAVESYQAMYLKAHFPHEYMVATLNNGGGFYRPELYVHEARMKGAKIMHPDINKSNALCVIEGDKIYLGFGMIAELNADFIADLVKERETNGPFPDLASFIKRTQVPTNQACQLIRAGAFAYTGKSKKKLLWEAHLQINPARKKSPIRELFEVPHKDFKLPDLNDTPLEDAYDDLELFGFTLCSPWNILRHQPASDLCARDVRERIGKEIEITGQLVAVKYTSTTRGDRMYFGTFVDREGHWIDTVHFPPSARAFPFKGPGCYTLKGKVVEEYDFISMEVSEMRRIPWVDREAMTMETAG
jgi:DNA polymerase III subunit alpha